MFKKFVFFAVLALFAVSSVSSLKCYICEGEGCKEKELKVETCEVEAWPVKITTTTQDPAVTTTTEPTDPSKEPTTTTKEPTTTTKEPTTTTKEPTTTTKEPTTTTKEPTTTTKEPTTTTKEPTTTTKEPTTTTKEPTTTTKDPTPELPEEGENNEAEAGQQRSVYMHKYLRNKRSLRDDEDFLCGKIFTGEDKTEQRGCTKRTCKSLKEEFGDKIDCREPCNKEGCNFAPSIKNSAFMTILLVAIVKFFY